MPSSTHPNIPSTTSPDDPEARYVKCEHCALYPLCDPVDIAGDDLNLIEGLLERRTAFKAGEVLFDEQDPFNAIFAISAGSFKLVLPDEKNDERVCGFSLRGELVGFSGMAVGHYPFKAIALEQSYVCEIPYQRLMNYAEKVPELRNKLFTMLGMEGFHSQQSFTTLIGRKNVDQRVAAFLINLLQRTYQRGFEDGIVNLGMRRDDIASFLGLPKETLSRALSKLQQTGQIKIDGRQLQILDRQGIFRTAGIACEKAG